MVRIRLKRTGRIHEAIYRIVVADSRSPLDGKFIEEIGFYNPNTKEIRIDGTAKDAWLKKGAKPSETVKSLFKHLEHAKVGKNDMKVLNLKPHVKKSKKIATEVKA